MTPGSAQDMTRATAKSAAGSVRWARDAPAPSDVLLADGRIGTLRRVTAADESDVALLHEGLTQESVRLRFFSLSRVSVRDYVTHVISSCEGDHLLAMGLWHQGRLLGLATAELSGEDAAEIAFVVGDGEHRHGVATLLLEHLAAAARAVGVRQLTADVLVDNSPMLRVLHDVGFSLEHGADQGVVGIRLDTRETARSLAAADGREASSESASLRPLLHPRSVAVVGVRRDGTGVGAAILSAILDGGFAGTVTVVHPLGGLALDVPVVASLDDLTEIPDLVIVAVPPAQVVDTIASAGRCGIRAAVVVTSGFAEMGEEGRLAQLELVRVARSHDIRLVGPNCLGLLDNQPDVRLDATFGGKLPPAGGLAVASQSGGVGIVVLEAARRLGLGVRHFVSLGNKADVSSNDLLEAWLDDDAVTSAALYLESFGNSAKFARIARRFSERKPLIAVVGGRTRSGQRAGASHTAAAATPAVRVDALLAQAGVVACVDADDVAMTALILSEQPWPAGPRVAVLGNAGGLGVLAADALAEEGLAVPALSDDVQRDLRGQVQATLGTSNPIDVGAAASPRVLGDALEALLRTDEIDSVLCVLARTRTMDWAGALGCLARARGRHPGKTVLAVLLGDEPPGPLPGITVLPDLHGAVIGLGHVTRYAAWRAQPREQAPLVEPVRAAGARGCARRLLDSGGPRWLDPSEIRSVLAPYGIRPVGTLVRGVAAAVEEAQLLGLPVAIKVADPRAVHKTERGLVRTDLSTTDDVAMAATEIARVVEDERVRLLVQPMFHGTEIALGIVHDPGLGPLVRVAAGGVATELWDDQRLLLAPAATSDARSALRSLRIWPLLAGFRGGPEADVDSLCGLVTALGMLACEVRELVELDLNPVLVDAHGCAVVDAKVRVAAPEPWDSGVPRRLRPTDGGSMDTSCRTIDG